MNLSAAPLIISLLLTGTLGNPAASATTAPVPVAESLEVQAPTSLDPAVEFFGGSTAARQTVVAAVDRYVSVGLALPDLEVHIYPDMGACGSAQGVFHEENGVGVIDLCFDRELLALHEIGHAWARFNLDDEARAEFSEFAGAPAWAGHDLTRKQRGTELAAGALSHGLLSVPLESPGQRAMQLARFNALTGFESPRLAEMDARSETAPSMSQDGRAKAAAYAEWRQEGADA